MFHEVFFSPLSFLLISFLGKILFLWGFSVYFLNLFTSYSLALVSFMCVEEIFFFFSFLVLSS